MPRLSDDNLIWIDLEMTGSSGLVERVRLSKHTAQTAEQATLDFVGQWVPAGRSPMSGNSICQDRRFMARQMPGLENYFHYRNLDVSTCQPLGTSGVCRV